MGGQSMRTSCHLGAGCHSGPVGMGESNKDVSTRVVLGTVRAGVSFALMPPLEVPSMLLSPPTLVPLSWYQRHSTCLDFNSETCLLCLFPLWWPLTMQEDALGVTVQKHSFVIGSPSLWMRGLAWVVDYGVYRICCPGEPTHTILIL